MPLGMGKVNIANMMPYKLLQGVDRDSVEIQTCSKADIIFCAFHRFTQGGRSSPPLLAGGRHCHTGIPLLAAGRRGRRLAQVLSSRKLQHFPSSQQTAGGRRRSAAGCRRVPLLAAAGGRGRPGWPAPVRQQQQSAAAAAGSPQVRS